MLLRGYAARRMQPDSSKRHHSERMSLKRCRVSNPSYVHSVPHDVPR